MVFLTAGGSTIEGIMKIKLKGTAMTIAWLIVWVLSKTPAVFFWNDWCIGLAVCLIIDVLSNTKE